MNIYRASGFAAWAHQGAAPGLSMCNGGGGGSSSSSSSSTTTSIDKRMVVDQGIGITSDQSTVTVQALDGQIVSKALDTVAAADATAGEGFERLLGLAENLFSAGGKLVEKTSDTAMAAVGAVSTAQNDAKGAIDQKTLVILAAAGVGAAYLLKKG